MLGLRGRVLALLTVVRRLSRRLGYIDGVRWGLAEAGAGPADEAGVANGRGGRPFAGPGGGWSLGSPPGAGGAQPRGGAGGGDRGAQAAAGGAACGVARRRHCGTACGGPHPAVPVLQVPPSLLRCLVPAAFSMLDLLMSAGTEQGGTHTRAGTRVREGTHTKELGQRGTSLIPVGPRRRFEGGKERGRCREMEAGFKRRQEGDLGETRQVVRGLL